MGLEPGSGFGHCYLIPFKKKDRTGKVISAEVTLIPGYKGMIELVNRSDRLDFMINMPVCIGDAFHYRITSQGIDINHEPNLDIWNPTEDNVRLIYCLAKLRGGGIVPEIMSRQQINDNERKNRKGQNRSAAWNDYWVQMGRKTVIRRIYNYLPKSTEMLLMAQLQDADGRGMAEFAKDMGLDKIPEQAHDEDITIDVTEEEPEEDGTEGEDIDVDALTRDLMGENVEGQMQQ
jgi:recombination protein RecT